MKAAHEFEEQLLRQLLKPMTDSDGLTGDTLTGSAQALRQAMSPQGGWGWRTGLFRSEHRR